MPYGSVSELPSQTSKLSPKKKRQFMHVVNSALASGDSEESAFKQAWSAVSKDYDSWDIISRQVNQETANYKVLGGTAEKACASCQWFVSPDSCVVVLGIISPTGISDLYREADMVTMARESTETTPAEIPQTTPEEEEIEEEEFDDEEEEEEEEIEEKNYEVDKKKKKKRSIKELAQTLLVRFGMASPPRVPYPPVQDLVFTKGDRTRFFVVYSNQFKDREASILTEQAHKEFETWADQTGHYPELWFWHAKGAKLGQVDWLHYADGMACASGYVDKDAESIIDKMGAAFGRLGVSHGFFSAATKNGLVSRYRTYEISLLPIERAANGWTTVNLLKDLEEAMAFSDAKRQALLTLYGDQDKVTQFERDTEAMAAALKAAGIEHKEVEEVDLSADVRQMVKEFGEYAASMNKAVADLTDRVANSEKDFDTKFSQAWTSRVAELPKAFEASSADSTVVDSKEAEKLKPNSLEEFLNKAYGGVA